MWVRNLFKIKPIRSIRPKKTIKKKTRRRTEEEDYFFSKRIIDRYNRM